MAKRLCCIIRRRLHEGGGGGGGRGAQGLHYLGNVHTTFSSLHWKEQVDWLMTNTVFSNTGYTKDYEKLAVFTKLITAAETAAVLSVVHHEQKIAAQVVKHTA